MEGKRLVTKEMGEKFANDVKAIAYLECSAKTRSNLKNIFDTSFDFALSTKYQKNQ